MRDRTALVATASALPESGATNVATAGVATGYFRAYNTDLAYYRGLPCVGMVPDPAVINLRAVSGLANNSKPRAQIMDMVYFLLLAVDPDMCNPRRGRPMGQPALSPYFLRV